MSKFTNSVVKDLLGKDNKLTNHVGVEVELEHENMPEDLPQEVARYWNAESDGSLRLNGAEYVLKRPMDASKAKLAVSLLGKHVSSTNKVIDAGRAGIHVHINVGDLTIREMMNFITITHILDDILVNWCGDKRKGNLFCLRLSDADYLVNIIVEMLEREDLRVLNTDAIRYSSVNLKAIPQYGSVEFRSMNSDGNWANIGVWIDTLLHLKDVARSVDSPSQIVSTMSNSGPSLYVDQILGPYSRYFEKYQGFDIDIYKAVRRVQEYAFCKEW